jgi:hypothetical protein
VEPCQRGCRVGSPIPGDFIDTFKRARIAFHQGGDFPMIFPGQPATPAKSAPLH